MVGSPGIEPGTSRLKVGGSTVELGAHAWWAGSDLNRQIEGFEPPAFTIWPPALKLELWAGRYPGTGSAICGQEPGYVRADAPD